ncbi:unnamed protein product [Urochloa humidicola]
MEHRTVRGCTRGSYGSNHLLILRTSALCRPTRRRSPLRTASAEAGIHRVPAVRNTAVPTSEHRASSAAAAPAEDSTSCRLRRRMPPLSPEKAKMSGKGRPPGPGPPRRRLALPTAGFSGDRAEDPRKFAAAPRPWLLKPKRFSPGFLDGTQDGRGGIVGF